MVKSSVSVVTPEIVWHDEFKPVLSIDMHQSGRFATAGADHTVRIWRFETDDSMSSSLSSNQFIFLSCLSHHEAAVNVVRFSPNGQFLASAGDDKQVIIWKLNEDVKQAEDDKLNFSIIENIEVIMNDTCMDISTNNSIPTTPTYHLSINNLITNSNEINMNQNQENLLIVKNSSTPIQEMISISRESISSKAEEINDIPDIDNTNIVIDKSPQSVEKSHSIIDLSMVDSEPPSTPKSEQNNTLIPKLTPTSTSTSKQITNLNSTITTTPSTAALAQPSTPLVSIDMSDVPFGVDPSNLIDNKEHWIRVNTLRGHLSEIYSLCWSSDSLSLVSGSIDGQVIVHDLSDMQLNPLSASTKRPQLQQFEHHKAYVQGIAIDPIGEYLATQSNDRSVRIYKSGIGSIGKKSSKLEYSPFANIKATKMILSKYQNQQNMDIGQQEKESDSHTRNENESDKENENMNGNDAKPILNGLSSNLVSIPTSSSPASSHHFLYLDETLPSFFRRLTFSPNGDFLFTPSGIYQSINDEKELKPHLYSSYIFTRDNLTRPLYHLPHPEPSICIKFSPILYRYKFPSSSSREAVSNLLTDNDNVQIYSIATTRHLFIYSTNSEYPLFSITNIHFASLTDIAWSSDGNIILLSSSDGYVSIIKLDQEVMKEHGFFRFSIEEMSNFQLTIDKKREEHKRNAVENREKKKKRKKGKESAKEKKEEKTILNHINCIDSNINSSDNNNSVNNISSTEIEFSPNQILSGSIINPLIITDHSSSSTPPSLPLLSTPTTVRKPIKKKVLIPAYSLALQARESKGDIVNIKSIIEVCGIGKTKASLVLKAWKLWKETGEEMELPVKKASVKNSSINLDITQVSNNQNQNNQLIHHNNSPTNTDATVHQTDQLTPNKNKRKRSKSNSNITLHTSKVPDTTISINEVKNDEEDNSIQEDIQILSTLNKNNLPSGRSAKEDINLSSSTLASTYSSSPTTAQAEITTLSTSVSSPFSSPSTSSVLQVSLHSAKKVRLLCSSSKRISASLKTPVSNKNKSIQMFFVKQLPNEEENKKSKSISNTSGNLSQTNRHSNSTVESIIEIDQSPDVNNNQKVNNELHFSTPNQKQEKNLINNQHASNKKEPEDIELPAQYTNDTSSCSSKKLLTSPLLPSQTSPTNRRTKIRKKVAPILINCLSLIDPPQGKFPSLDYLGMKNNSIPGVVFSNSQIEHEKSLSECNEPIPDPNISTVIHNINSTIASG